jgi:hypothetical protein
VTRRNLVLACIAVVVLAYCGWRLWERSLPASITQATADRIEVGMTLDEVERILGKAPGNLSSVLPDEYYIWKAKGKSGGIRVWLKQGRVTRVQFDPRFSAGD